MKYSSPKAEFTPISAHDIVTTSSDALLTQPYSTDKTWADVGIDQVSNFN